MQGKHMVIICKCFQYNWRISRCFVKKRICKCRRTSKYFDQKLDIETECVNSEERHKVGGGDKWEGQNFDSWPPKPNTIHKNKPFCLKDHYVFVKKKAGHGNFTFFIFLALLGSSSWPGEKAEAHVDAFNPRFWAQSGIIMTKTFTGHSKSPTTHSQTLSRHAPDTLQTPLGHPLKVLAWSTGRKDCGLIYRPLCRWYGVA